MAKHKVTAKNVTRTLRKLADQLDNRTSLYSTAAAQHDDRAYVAEHLEYMLNEMCAEDFFGTECQNDPRGDQRD